MHRRVAWTLAWGLSLTLGVVGCSRKSSKSKGGAGKKQPAAAMGTAAAVGPGPGGAMTPRPAPRRKVPKGPTVSITPKAPKVGQKIQQNLIALMHLNLISEGKTMRFRSHLTSNLHVEILAVKGLAVTKLRVTYKEKKERSEQMGLKEKKSSPLKGRTYVVEAAGGKVVVRDKKGKALEPELSKLVLQDFETLGKPDPLLTALGKGPIPLKRPLPALATAMKTRLLRALGSERANDVTFKSFTVELKRTKTEAKKKLAEFHFVAELDPKDTAELPVGMKLSGTLTVRLADGWSTALNFDGPLLVGPKKMGRTKSALGFFYE